MYARLFSVILAGLVSASPLLAAENTWDFKLTPYLWLAGLKGDIATNPPLPPAPVDVSANDAIADTNAALMLLFDASKGRHGLFADLLYSDIQSDEELIPAPIALGVKSTSKTTVFTLAYQYGIYQRENAAIKLLAGARYWNIDTELAFSGGSGVLAGQKLSNDESWVDPALGIRGRSLLGGSRFYFGGGAAIGGFGVGSDSFYEVTANIGYQWNRAIGTVIGYRVFDVDYENDGFSYDVKQQGWQIGLTWTI